MVTNMEKWVSTIALSILALTLLSCQSVRPQQVVAGCLEKDGDVDCQENRGGTTEREPTTAPPDEPFVGGTTDCRVGLLLEMGIRRTTGGSTTLSHNLKHGFSEVVVPKGYDLRIVKYEPVPSATGPYKGTFSSMWTAGVNVRQASVHGNAGNIVRKFKRKRRTWRNVPGNPPQVQNHTITASWDPDHQDPCVPPVSHTFKVIFAGDSPLPPPLQLRSFYNQLRQAGFTTSASGTGTRVLHEVPPKPRRREHSVHVPIGIYWEVGNDCCGIPNAVPKVIQFARAAIDGPNGRQGKPWTLDIKDSEADDTPDHDPTYTGQPGSDANETATNGGSGGTRRVGNDLMQWDAPGMPNALYHRLLHAEGASTFRQQFLSLLVCRPNPGGSNKHKAGSYLSNSKVKQVAITTVTWRFPGQEGVDRTVASNLRQPTVTVKFHTSGGGCRSLQGILAANALTNAFQHPSEKARKLEILPEGRYQTLLDDLKAWETSPESKVQFP